MRVLLIILMVLCVTGYISIKNKKYAGIRRLLPTVGIFFLCLFIFMRFLDMFRYQIGFAEFFKGLFSGF